MIQMTVPTKFLDAEADLSSQTTMHSIRQAERFNDRKHRELVDAYDFAYEPYNSILSAVWDSMSDDEWSSYQWDYERVLTSEEVFDL
jgi:hypothetical protein